MGLNAVTGDVKQIPSRSEIEEVGRIRYKQKHALMRNNYCYPSS